MRKEYRLLLSSLAHQINADELVTMKFLCADFISYPGSLETQPNNSCLMEVFGFFIKLETKNKLGIDDLDLLKEMLSHLMRDDLLLKVTEFQVQRQAYLSSLGIAERESETSQTTRSQQEESPEEEQRRPSEPQDRGDQQGAVGSQTSRGALVMQCAPYLVGGAWAVGSVYILNRYKEDPKALVNIASEVVVPTGTLIKSIFAGSINFLLQATDLNSLKELWKRYQSGELKKDLQKVLVTEELKNLANGEPIDLVVTISEQEYRNACLDLMVAQTKAQVLYKGITSSQHATQLSRSLPDLKSLDTIQNLSRGSLLAQLSDELKMRQRSRIERLSSTVWSTENVSSLLEQINAIQFEITSIEALMGKSCDGKTSMGHHTLGREVYDRVKRTNLGFCTFMDQLEEAKMFLKNERFLLDPQEAVKRLVLFASKMKRYGLDDDHLKIALEEIFDMLPFVSFQSPSNQRKLRASVRAVVTKLKEMAKLLVKIFKLNPELLKDLDLLMLSDSDKDDYPAMGKMGLLPFSSPSLSSSSKQEAKVPKEASSINEERPRYLKRKVVPLQSTVVHSRPGLSLLSSRLRSSRRELEIPSLRRERKASPGLDKPNKSKTEQEMFMGSDLSFPVDEPYMAQNILIQDVDLFKLSDDDEDDYPAMGRLKFRLTSSLSDFLKQETKVPKKATSMEGEKLKYVQGKDPLQTQSTEAK